MFVWVLTQWTPFVTLVFRSPITYFSSGITTSHFITCHTDQWIVLFQSLCSLDKDTQCKILISERIRQTTNPFRCCLPFDGTVIVINLAIRYSVRATDIRQLHITSFCNRVPIQMVATGYLIFLPDSNHCIIINHAYRMSKEPTVTQVILAVPIKVLYLILIPWKDQIGTPCKVAWNNITRIQCQFHTFISCFTHIGVHGVVTSYFR